MISIKATLSKKLLIIVSILLIGSMGLNAQTVLPCYAIASSYGIDSALVEDTTQVTQWLNTLPDTSLGNRGTQCALLNTKVQHMLSSLRNTYPEHDGKLWIDSNTCITDHKTYALKLSALSKFLMRKAAEYDRREQERILTELRVAEQEARAKAQAEQQARNDSLAALKTAIIEMHRQISQLTDGESTDDRRRQARLKDIYFCYLSLYNKYDLSPAYATSVQLQQLRILLNVQRSITDSLLGPNSYDRRIAAFVNTIKQRCATGHKEVSKAYYQNFHGTEIPVNFSNVAEYRDFVNKLEEMICVQEYYLRSVDILEQMDRGTATVMHRAAKRRNVQASYKAALASLDKVPAFVSPKEGDAFLRKLEDFVETQQQYIVVMDHMDSIDLRGKEVVYACGKHFADVAAAYNELASTYDFSPSFTTSEGAAFYDKTLDDFEEMQDAYLKIIDLRQTIKTQDDKLLDNKKLPREVRSGYKLIKGLTQIKPDFSTMARGELFIDGLKKFISLQGKVEAIAYSQLEIDNDEQRLKLMGKANRHTVNAYKLLRHDMKQDFTITAESDLDEYAKYQERQRRLQGQFINIIQSNERTEYNRRFQGVRDPTKIRLILDSRKS
ncbi:MAG: hypothetical protein SPJ13_03440 [Bacteroidales bacterium]|nr:hypothetical protein [Bacteroidales bacterium]